MRRVVTVAAVCVAALVLAAAVAILGRDRGGEADGQTTRRSMLIATAISPRVHLFGDPVVAEVRLLFDRRRVRADDVRIDAVFEPYEAGRPALHRTDSGDLTELRYRYPLTCLTRACMPRGARRERTFAPVRIFYTLSDIRQRANDLAEWPALVLTSRIGAADVAQARWRADVSRLPRPSYTVDPTLLATVFFGLALTFLLAAGALARRALATSSTGTPDLADEAVAGSPVAQAVALVREECADGFTNRARLALERLARELDHAGHALAGAEARRLAWSPDRPSRAEVERLTDEVEQLDGSAS